MVAAGAVVEHTTVLALHEKAKLRKALRRFDMLFFLVCAFVGLDTLGLVASSGGEGFTWLLVLALAFVFPYALVMAEVGSAFTMEGGPYEWTKLAFGRFHAGIAAVFYWVTNPLWVGGSLAFVATAAWNTSHDFTNIGPGSAADFIFKLAFIWFSIGVAIVSLRRGKWIPTAGGLIRIVVLGFFTVTVIVYGAKHGLHGISGGDLSPSSAVFLALVPYLLFNYVGFELQNGAAEEMVDPQRDVPITVIRSGILGVLMYAIPVLGILLVLPKNAISGISGFIDAIQKVFTVYGGSGDVLFDVMALGFIFTLMTSGAVWMMGSDRIQAVAAYDGAFPGFFGVFNAKLGTLPEVHRPYRVPFGDAGIWIGSLAITLWVALGTWVSIFPGRIERWTGIAYDFKGTWGVSFPKFEALTLGTLGVILLLAVVGYALGAPVRRRQVDVPLEAPAEAPAALA